MPWIETDVKGLAKLIADKPKVFILNELVQNAMDENTTRIDVHLHKESSSRYAEIKVVDDNPTGFADLSHAFTLFAESQKKGNPLQRGRFNMGEKLVLALCKDATIETTTGTVIFLEDGTRKVSRGCTSKGSVFTARVKMTNLEFEQMKADVMDIIPSKHIQLIINGIELKPRVPLVTFSCALPTVIADDDGVLRPTTRTTDVEVYRPHEGEHARIYEMGIPVVETKDTFHVNVMQKVPLNMDRDNVPPSYLRKLRTEVANHTADLLSKAEACEVWVDDALANPNIETEAVQSIVKTLFGDKAVAYDPSDREASYNAVSKGYAVIAGGTFNAPQWANIKKAGIVKPAGQVFPTPKPYSDDPNAPLAEVIPWNEQTHGMQDMVRRVQKIGRALIGKEITVRIVRAGLNFGGCYGGRTMDLNLNSLGYKFFDNYPNNKASVLNLVIHELAHEYASNHLEEAFHKACTRLGGEMVMLQEHQPELFK